MPKDQALGIVVLHSIWKACPLNHGLKPYLLIHVLGTIWFGFDWRALLFGLWSLFVWFASWSWIEYETWIICAWHLWTMWFVYWSYDGNPNSRKGVICSFGLHHDISIRIIHEVCYWYLESIIYWSWFMTWLFVWWFIWSKVLIFMFHSSIMVHLKLHNAFIGSCFIVHS